MKLTCVGVGVVYTEDGEVYIAQCQHCSKVVVMSRDDRSALSGLEQVGADVKCCKEPLYLWISLTEWSIERKEVNT